MNGPQVISQLKDKEQSRVPELKIGIQIASLGQPLKVALQTAARLGATGVEIDARADIRPKELTDTGRRQLKKWMDDLNLRVASVRFRTRRGYDVLQDLDQRIDATKDAMRLAYTLGCNVVVNQIGMVPEDVAHPSYSQLQICLTDLARFGQHVGAMLAAETGSEPGERLAGLLDSTAEKTIGIAYNPANLIANNFSAEESLVACAPHILLVHARDAVRDLARGRGIDVPLGRGSAEFPSILAHLEQRHYNGWFVIDHEPTPTAIEEIGYGVSFLKAL
jgi:sugar phosphate isomerase/epimerase